MSSKKVVAIDDRIRLNKEAMKELEKELAKMGDDITVISKKEMFAIMEKARERYIKKYGVDPANPKVEVVDEAPLPQEYVKELVKSGKLSLKESESLKVSTLATTSSTSGPEEKDGWILVYIMEAKDDAYGHKPDGTSWVSDTEDAVKRFETNFGVTMYTTFWWNIWDISDISPSYDSEAALDDLKKEYGNIIETNPDNEIVFGWADNLDHNGRALPNDFFSVGSESPAGLSADWPDDSVVQHEISHNFNASEGGWWPWEHPECIMNYWYAYQGTDIWCDDCWDRVFVNIWGISDV